MQRRLLAATAIVWAIAGTACGAPGTTGSADSRIGPIAAPLASAVPANPGRRMVVDVKGRTVDVPPHAERIVALSEPTLDGLLATGVAPVGISAGRGQTTTTAYLADLVGDATVVATLGSPNLEAIAVAQPDLIVTDATAGTDTNTLELLSAIAPTVFVSTPGEDWKTAFRALAEATGRTDATERVIANHEAQVAALRAELGERLAESVSIVRWGQAAPAMILKELPPGQVLAEIGLPRPPAQDREGLGRSEPISVEELELLDADWIFFGTLIGGAEATSAALARAEATPGFTALDAYQSGRLVVVDGSAWASAGGPIAAGVIVDDVAAALLATDT